MPLAKGLARRLAEVRGVVPNEAPVFASANGAHLDADNVCRRILKPAARRAGLPWIGFHTFRHSCATLLFRNGFNAKQVHMWLGHHSPAFTLATYVHLLPDDLPDANFLDDLTRGETDKTFATAESVNGDVPAGPAPILQDEPGWAGTLEAVEVELGSAQRN